MISAGIDCGAKNVRAVVLGDGRVLAKSILSAGMNTARAAEQGFESVLKDAGLGRDQVDRVVSTGAGKDEARFSDGTVSDVGAAARAIHELHPDVRTVIDVGAEEGRAIRIDAAGKVVDFAVNEKCAAGAGAFTEAMARALEISLEDLGELSLHSTQAIPMNAQCAVFAESEVVSLVHRKTPKPDMARAIHDAIADRITAMVRRVGIEQRIALVGGVAMNVGFVKSLEEALDSELVVVDQPQFVGAIGAAWVAAQKQTNAGDDR